MFNSTNLVGFNRRVNSRRKSWCHSKGNLYVNYPNFCAKYVGDHLYLTYGVNNGTYTAINVVKIDKKTNSVVWSRKITKSYNLTCFALDVSANGSRLFVAIQSGANLSSILELSVSTGADVSAKDVAYIAKAIAFNNAENRLYVGGTSNNQFGWIASIDTSTWSSGWSKTTSNQDTMQICVDETNGGAWHIIEDLYGVYKNNSAGTQVTAFGYQAVLGKGYDLALIGGQLHILAEKGHCRVDVSGTPTHLWGRYFSTFGALPYKKIVSLNNGEVFLVENNITGGIQGVYHFKSDNTPTNRGCILERQGSGKFSQDLDVFFDGKDRLLLVGQADSLNVNDDYAVLCVEYNINAEWSGNSPDPTYMNCSLGQADTVMTTSTTGITYPFTTITYGTAAALTLSTVTTTNSADTVAVEKFAFF